MKKWFAAPAFLLVAVPLFAASDPSIRVGIMSYANGIKIGPGAVWIQGRTDLKKFLWKKPVRAMILKNGFLIDKTRWGPKILLLPADEKEPLLINGRPYRGTLELVRTGSGFRVVNELSVEDYVKGILIMEASLEWPPEALKAQAVISRTYALHNRGRHGAQGFDMCADIHCQVYAGARAERAVTDRAVEETRGEVLIDRERRRLINAVFHSCCGGSTESAEYVWNTPPSPNLKAVRCEWCKHSPRYNWAAKITTDVVSRGLKATKHKVGKVTAIGILSHTPTGRVDRIRVYGTEGIEDMRADSFRAAVDPHRLRSAFWTAVSHRGDVWQFHGKGWGHGVGLCQWGMKDLADKNMKYDAILRMYYTATRLVKTVSGRIPDL